MHPLRLFCLVAACAAGAAALAEEEFPGADWRDVPSPLASEHAVVGGEFVLFAGQFPKSLNYLLDTTVSSAQVFGQLYESLLSENGLTLELEPNLASGWSLSDDKRTFTFRIDGRARWSDGRPVTAADVRWTYDTIMDPKNLTGPHKVGLERFEPPEVVDERTIRFTAKRVHWDNLIAVGFMPVLPRHAYASIDFNKLNFEFPVVSGLYRIAGIKEGFHVLLERRDDWWQQGAPRYRGLANFSRLRLRYFTDRDNAFESFKKGEVDIYPVYTAQLWAAQTSGERFAKNWIAKQSVHNRKPVGFQGYAMNLRRPLFADVRVRRALAHLLHREKMNRTLMHDAYFLHRSYYEDLYGPDHPCENEFLGFDPERARALLAEAGWEADPATGLLQKDGQPFLIRFLTREGNADRFLAIYKEDLRNVGVDLEIVRKDWAAWVKDMDEYNYDMTWAAWGAGVRKDPEPMWYSKEADRPSGQNITGFRHPEVDRLIEEQRGLFDLERRNEIVRRIDRILAAEVPYILLWNIAHTRLLYWNRFGMPPTVLGKYGGENASVGYWWYDEDAAADLEYARDEGHAMPKRPGKVVFDEVFRPVAAAVPAVR